MTKENLDELAGTDEQGAGATGDTETPSDSSQSPQGGGDSDKPKPRTLAELDEQSKRSGFKMTPEEARRVHLAAAKGLTDEDAITKALNSGKQDGQKAKSEAQQAGDGKQSGDNPDDDRSGEPGAEGKQDTKPNEPGEVDSQLLKVIAPHLGDDANTVEDAVKAIKNLQFELSRRGEFINAAKEFGIKDVEGLKEATSMLKTIDATIAEKLKSPDGLAGMYKAYGMDVPEWLSGKSGGEPGAQKTSSQEPSAPMDIAKLMSNMEDDGYIGVSDFKKLVPALIEHVQTSVSKKYEGLESNFKQVGAFVSKLAQQHQASETVNQALSDATAIAESFSRFDDSLALDASPATIWGASVAADGRTLKKAPHPEFEKLKRILKLRRTALDDARERSQKLGRRVDPDVLGFLSKQLITSGGLEELTRSAKETAAQRIITNLTKKLQPGVSSKKGAKSSAFKTPKSEKDVAKMSAEDKKKFLSMLRQGKLKIQV